MSNIACDTSARPLDEQSWCAFCESAAAEAGKGCGLSFDVYVNRLSEAVDERIEQLPEHQRARAAQLAKRNWDYATPADRQAAQDWNAQHGYCVHGIKFGNCPLGCESDDVVEDLD
ncbi:hypothetical protein ACIU0H_28545 [Pseudomonas aeruginosa]